MKNQELIELAASVCHPKTMGKNTAGGVGCALLSDKGNIYTGVCIDTVCGMGFCAEHAAIAAMVTAREYKIKKIVAVRNDKKKRAIVIHPCGRCREFIYQIDKNNINTDVILDKDKAVKLKKLLPY